MLEYIQRVRKKQSWLYEEINYRNHLKREKRQSEEKLLRIKLTLEKGDTNDSLYNTIHEQQMLMNHIDNIELHIKYSTIRISYYTENCKITTTIG